MRVYACHSTRVNSEDKSVELVLSLYVGLGDGTQITRLAHLLSPFRIGHG